MTDSSNRRLGTLHFRISTRLQVTTTRSGWWTASSTTARHLSSIPRMGNDLSRRRARERVLVTGRRPVEGRPTDRRVVVSATAACISRRRVWGPGITATFSCTRRRSRSPSFKRWDTSSGPYRWTGGLISTTKSHSGSGMRVAGGRVTPWLSKPETTTREAATAVGPKTCCSPSVFRGLLQGSFGRKSR